MRRRTAPDAPDGRRVVVELGGRRLRALRFRRSGGRVVVEAAATLEGASPRDTLRRLKRDGWFGSLRVMLGVRQRETAVLPRPPVEDAELVQAVRWQLADALPFPPDEAVVDAITLFDDEPAARRQVMVVAVQRSLLKAWLEPILSVRGLVPECIDVADLAQRNLVEAAVGRERSVACLTEREEALLFTISRGRDLLHSRVFELAARDGDTGVERLAERVGVQLQRAIDTLERRSPEHAPVRLLTGPASAAAPIDAIAALCGLPTTALDWNAGVEVEPAARADLDADPALLHLVGAALRAPAAASAPAASGAVHA